MASSNDNVSMALFCDFENVALGVRDANYDKFDIKPVLERLLLKGSIVVKKAYCDWDRYKAFKAPMHEANFELIEIPHVRQSGKNSADIRMVVDALDLCYTKSHVDTFVIISGDSDFSPLVSKLRENAKKVIGVGVKQSTSDLLVANCDEFIFYDDLVRESRRAKREASNEAKPAVKRSPEEERARRDEMDKRRNQAVEIAVNTFEALVLERGDSGKIWASVLKEAIKRRKPDFSESYYGFRTFGNLIEECKARGLLEFGRDEKSGAYVYRSSNSAAQAGMSASNEAPAADGANGDVQEERNDGRQESRRSRGRGRSAAERFAERQAERLAQQARAGNGSADTAIEIEPEASDITQAQAAYAARVEAANADADESDASPADAVQADAPQADGERGRGRGRGNRGGRKQGERQSEQRGEAATSIPQAAVEVPVPTPAPVVEVAPVEPAVVAPAKKKNGAKPPARKVKAAAVAAKPKAEAQAVAETAPEPVAVVEEAKPAKGGRNAKGGKANGAAGKPPAAQKGGANAKQAAKPAAAEAAVVAQPVAETVADAAPAAKPAKPGKPKAAAKPAGKAAPRAPRPAKAAATDE